MHRFPRADDEWKADTRQKIQEAVTDFERELKRLRAAGDIANRTAVAMNLNQVAWLVGNTGSDKQAVERSRKSLELRPQTPGYLDTLGRAYFSVGDLKNALKYQRRAARLEPFSQQIQRQLKEFEDAAKLDATRE